jgi:hypothetical protein
LPCAWCFHSCPRSSLFSYPEAPDHARVAAPNPMLGVCGQGSLFGQVLNRGSLKRRDKVTACAAR